MKGIKRCCCFISCQLETAVNFMCGYIFRVLQKGRGFFFFFNEPVCALTLVLEKSKGGKKLDRLNPLHCHSDFTERVSPNVGHCILYCILCSPQSRAASVTAVALQTRCSPHQLKDTSCQPQDVSM